MAKVGVELIGDDTSLERTFKNSKKSGQDWEQQMKRLSATAATSAQTQISAAVRTDARLRAQIAVYRQVASTAQKGSREQAAAANLAERAEKRLSASMAVTAHESRVLGSSTSAAGRDIERFGRGILSGSGLMHGFGRAAVFASTSVLGGAGLTYAFRTVVKAATEQKATIATLQNAVRSAGLSYRDLRPQIETTLRSMERLGFTEDDASRTLGQLVRGTRNVTTATKEEALAADIARARHIALSTASNAVARAYGGQTGALRRLVPFIKAGVSATQAIRQAQAAYAGEAERVSKTAAGAQDRFNVALHTTEETIGRGVLPAVTQYLNRGSEWLSQSKNQARIQRDVHNAVRDVSQVVGALGDIIRTVMPLAKGLTKELGGLGNTVKILTGAFVGLKILKIAGSLNTISGSAEGAAGKVGLLNGRLGLLARFGTIGVSIAVVETIIRRFDHNSSPSDIAFLQRVGLMQKSAAPASINRADILGPARPLGLPSVVSGATAPNGLASLTARQRNQLSLSEAGRTTGTADDLSALAQQRALLAKNIAAVRGRLSHSTGKEARKFADELKGLLDEDSSAFSQIQSIQDSATRKQTSQISKAAAAAKKARAAFLAEVRGYFKGTFGGVTLGVNGGKPLTIATINAAIAKNEQRAQYQALGLTATGQDLAPTRKTLQAEAKKLGESLAGSTLDTPARQNELGRITKVLFGKKGEIGTLTRDTRTQIKQMIDQIDSDLKGAGGNQTKFRHVASDKLLAGLGLLPDQLRAARFRISQVGLGGTVPTPTGAFSLAGAGGGVTIHGGVHLHGVQNVKQLDNELVKVRKRRSGSRRGPYAGQH